MSQPRRLAAIGVSLALGLGLTLSGCAATGSPGAPGGTPVATTPVAPLAELDVPADPRDIEGPSTALLADAAIPVLEGDWPQQLPTTVVSHDRGGDREVTVPSAERIIAMDLSGSIAATLAGLGLTDRLVGRDVSTTFEGTEDLPLVTIGGHTVSSEAVLALRPDIVITDGSVGPRDVVEQLRDAGITVVFVTAEPSFEGVSELTRQVGAAVGMPEAGEALAAQLAEAIDAKIAEIAAIIPRTDPLRMVFLYLRGSAGVYYLFGDDSGADSLIRALGGIDAAAEVGIVGNRPTTDEALIGAAPDLVLVMTSGIESVGGVDGLLEVQPAIALTPAGERRRFVDMADGVVLGFGPRTPGVLDALARAIYAPAE
ncbi:MAG TPA: ABC transporter substrate-binding protein [Microbacteriaceae bacterium]|nr:ABC transporter substrate-binding protein [Microbacteriaceae bacterium]